jgi:hypothetical protein
MWWDVVALIDIKGFSRKYDRILKWTCGECIGEDPTSWIGRDLHIGIFMATKLADWADCPDHLHHAMIEDYTTQYLPLGGTASR